MVRLQRNAGKDGGIVVDGRDAGTVVFPNARFKFYLDADMEERAKRRYKELLEKKIKMDYTELFDDIKKRDMDDCSRELSPLKPADDAVIVDTTWMTIEDVLNRISGEISFYSSSFA
jgi:cytidylate kinase